MRNGRIAAEYAADAVQEEQLVDAMLASDTEAPLEALA